MKYIYPLLLLISLPINAGQVPSQKITLGLNERVFFYDLDNHLDGKIDISREYTKLKVDNIVEFERDGKGWVRFEIEDTIIEKMVKKWIKIKSMRNISYRTAPVVELLTDCGGIKSITDVHLSLTRGEERLLIGKNYIRDIAVIDIGHNYINTTARR